MLVESVSIEDTIRILDRFILNVSGLRYLENKRLAKPFGMSISLNFARVASLSWCKVFGADKEEHHWKKLISENIHTEFRQNLLTELRISDVEFQEVRNKIKNFRDNYVSHKEDFSEEIKIPDFTHALKACEVLYKKINPGICFNTLVQKTEEDAEEQLNCLLISD